MLQEFSKWLAMSRNRAFLPLLLGAAWMALLSAPPVQAQSLAEYYRERWFRETAERILEERGMRAQPMAPAHLASTSDSIRWRHDLRHRLDRSHIRRAPVDVRSVRAVRRLERPVFEDRFLSIQRTFISRTGRSPVDMERTRDLRARMEHEFGAPTRTVVDLYDEDRRRVQEYLQFEYWLIVNDSIPLIVMDVDGPFDRGLVFATEANYRELLPDLKRGFERTIMQVTRYGSYADYYYNEVERAWYVTGYDGERFVLRRIRTPDLRHGRPGVGMLR